MALAQASESSTPSFFDISFTAPSKTCSSFSSSSLVPVGRVREMVPYMGHFNSVSIFGVEDVNFDEWRPKKFFDLDAMDY